MKTKYNIIKHILTLFISTVFYTNVFAQLPPNNPAYELILYDDFDGASVDYTKWDRIPPWNQLSNIYNEVNCSPPLTTAVAYRKWKTNVHGQMDTTNCKVSNGTLKLITRKENYNGEVWDWQECDATTGLSVGGKKCNDTCRYNPINGKSICWCKDTLPYKYTSAMLYSKRDFRYGYFEIRFRLPQPPIPPKKHVSFGPNFWLFGADTDGEIGWINHWSEIDIFEINSFDLQNNYSNLITNCVHYRNCPDPTFHKGVGQVCGYISSNDWHTAAVNWAPTKIAFYLDGIKTRDFPCEEVGVPPDS